MEKILKILNELQRKKILKNILKKYNLDKKFKALFGRT